MTVAEIVGGIGQNQDKSELSVFHRFIARMRLFQKQIDKMNHVNGYQVGRLYKDVEIPIIQSVLKNRIPRRAQQAIPRI